MLVALSERGPIRVLELAAALGWEQSRVSHQLRRMRARDLLERRDSEHDRRGATVEITAAGRDALAAAAPDHVALVRSVLFDGTTRTQLRGFDEVIATALDRLATRCLNSADPPPQRAVAADLLHRAGSAGHEGVVGRLQIRAATP